jgi:hypothetical protein
MFIFHRMRNKGRVEFSDGEGGATKIKMTIEWEKHDALYACVHSTRKALLHYTSDITALYACNTSDFAALYACNTSGIAALYACNTSGIAALYACNTSGIAALYACNTSGIAALYACVGLSINPGTSVCTFPSWNIFIKMTYIDTFLFNIDTFLFIRIPKCMHGCLLLEKDICVYFRLRDNWNVCT